MPAYTEIIDRLIQSLTKLPGVGPKSAERILFHILKTQESDAEQLAASIIEVKEKIFFCEICFNLSSEKTCHICNDMNRQHGTICVVEEPKDVISFEKAGGYNGVYHVLLGALSPIDGIGPSQLRIKELLKRAEQEQTEEIILATNPNADGDATAMYLYEKLKDSPFKISRISKGVPVGSHFDYMDQATLSLALQDRKIITQL